MNDKQLKTSQYNPNFLSKTSSTRSCQNLLCLTKRCNEDETKEKERILNHQFFEKLSLKKFNNSTIINQSYYEKEKIHERSLKRDKSTEDSEFQNIIIQSSKYNEIKTTTKNINDAKHFSCNFQQPRRIARCSSHRQLEKPMFNTTDRSLSKQIQQDFRRIQDLQQLRNRLEIEIRSLDQNIDKYYLIYNSKLQQLKRIQIKMKEIGEQERLMQRVPFNDDLKSFKKKSFWEEFDGGKLPGNYKKQENPNAYNDISTYNTYKKSPSIYEPNNNISFARKAI